MLKHGILGLLNYQSMTGYEVMEAFRDSLNHFWHAQTSQIYKELQTLEQNGWVSKQVIFQTGKPNKNVYSITENGKTELLSWLADGGTMLNSRNSILMRVFFMGERSREENIAWFQRLKQECEEFLSKLAAVPKYIETYASYVEDKEKAAYWQMTMDFGRRNMQTYIDWAQECIDRLEKGD